MVETGITSRSLYCQQWNHEKKKVMGKENRIMGLANQLCPGVPNSLLSPWGDAVWDPPTGDRAAGEATPGMRGQISFTWMYNLQVLHALV